MTIVIINEIDNEVAYRISDGVPGGRRSAEVDQSSGQEAGEDRKVNVRRAPLLDGVVVIRPKAVVIAVLK